jgi:outer membrane protein assembly factor BamB
VARQGGIVVALDAATGRVLWEEETVARPAGSPVAAFGLLLVASGLSPVPPAAGEDLIYAAGGRGERALQAFDPRTGEERWRTGLPRDGIYALDPATGRERWLLDSPAMVSVSPVVRGGELYALDHALHRVYLGGGELWHAGLAEQTPRGLAAGDQAIFVAGDNSAALVDGMGQVEGWLAAFDAEDGEQRWRVSIGGPAWAVPVVAGDLVFIGGYDGVIYAFDAATGAARWRLTVEPGRPLATAAIADGLLVIGNDGGTLTAIVEGGDAGPVRANGLVHSHPAM